MTDAGSVGVSEVSARPQGTPESGGPAPGGLCGPGRLPAGSLGARPPVAPARSRAPDSWQPPTKPGLRLGLPAPEAPHSFRGHSFCSPRSCERSPDPPRRLPTPVATSGFRQTGLPARSRCARLWKPGVPASPGSTFSSGPADAAGPAAPGTVQLWTASTAPGGPQALRPPLQTQPRVTPSADPGVAAGPKRQAGRCRLRLSTHLSTPRPGCRTLDRGPPQHWATSSGPSTDVCPHRSRLPPAPESH